MWEMCPKILGSYEYQNLPNGGPKGEQSTIFFTNFGKNYHLFFVVEKVSSRMWEMCPKILGAKGTRTPEPEHILVPYGYQNMSAMEAGTAAKCAEERKWRK